MKKIFAAALFAASLLLVSAGCSGKNNQPLSEPPVQEQSSESDADVTDGDSTSSPEPSSEVPATTEAVHELERNIQPAEGTFVYDYANLLSDEDFAECNNYTEWLYETFLINAAVVTTDDIEGLTPAKYAEDAYIELYEGKGSGLLLLINNDTGEDYLYKTGSCLTSVSEDTQAYEFYWATQEIVSGDYKSAVLRLMKLGEACPRYVFDNGGVFTAEQLQTLESACAGSSISVLATSNQTGSTNEEICQSYFDRRYQGEKGTMIMADTFSKTLTVISNDGKNASAAALEKANTLAAAGNFAAAVTGLISDIQ